MERTEDLGSAWAQVATFAAAVDAKLGKWLTDTYGIGLSEYRAMNHLSQSSAKELRVNELAQKSGLNQSSVTRLLSRLEAKSLAYRDTCPDDGRGVYAVISEDGESLLARMHEAYDAKLEELLGEPAKYLPEIDLHPAGRALQAVSDRLLNR
ncbi:MarR family winged helix-turn-helix transcriptional regulator [Actinomadura adrarensis]|uniref:MarR family winged helix-turn-helix transcriptional regulator n=1 Tax=Actinomadura adrarensis TaxID=1819600 RepID=A0ABW3CSN1_9ACTN